jgi:hypothetical protein
MATLVAQTVTRAGIVPTYTAAAGGGDAAPCGADFFLVVINGGGSSITVTLAIPAGASGFGQVAYTSTVVTVVNATTRFIGPLQPQLYQDPTTGLCTITYSGVTTVTVGVFNVQEP